MLVPWRVPSKMVPPKKRKVFLLKARVSSAGSQLNSQGDGHWYGCTTGSGPIGGWVAQEVPRLRSSWLEPFKLSTIKTDFVSMVSRW